MTESELITASVYLYGREPRTGRWLSGKVLNARPDANKVRESLRRYLNNDDVFLPVDVRQFISRFVQP